MRLLHKTYMEKGRGPVPFLSGLQASDLGQCTSIVFVIAVIIIISISIACLRNSAPLFLIKIL